MSGKLLISAIIILLLFLPCRLSQETCALQENGELLCEAFHVSQLPVEKVALELKAGLDTGLEFLDIKLEWDEELFLGKDVFKKTPALEVVQIFIRRVKGVSGERLDSYIGSGEGDKTAWAFFPYRLAKLAKVEVEIYNALKKFFNEGRHPIFPLAQSYLRDMERSSILVTSNEVEIQKVGGFLGLVSQYDPYMYIATHPLLVYRMIRRFAEDLQPLLAQLQDYPDLMFSIYNANPDLEVFPNQEDLQDALLSILRIQVGHNLKSEEIAKGILANIDTRLGLNAIHSLEIGAFMIKEGRYDYALQWLHLASEAISTSKVHELNSFTWKIMSYAITEHNNKWLTKKDDRVPGLFTEQILNDFDPRVYTRMYDEIRGDAAKLENRKVADWYHWALLPNFEAVCSGEDLRTREERKNLTCFHYKPHPYWLISPLKLELLNKHPRLVQIYDFIGDELIKAIKKDAINGLQRSTVVDDDPSKWQFSVNRTSAQVWLFDNKEETKYLQGLSRKMEFLSGLIVQPWEASDAYQVAAYGTSHHYSPHIDAFQDIRRTTAKGNRIVTIMAYLSDVAVGGRTAFPVFGVGAEPVKGSIVMWESLMGDMISRDMRSYHGGCPVVLGVKWITNKWIYSKANMFKYPCFSENL